MTNNAVDPLPTSFEDPAQSQRPKAAKLRSRKSNKYLQKIIIATTFLILILTIALLVQAFKTTECRIETTVCPTKECTLSAATLINTIHREEDPCEDFYSFVCGKEDGSTSNVFQHLYIQLLKKLKYLLLKPKAPKESSAVTKAKKFYKECMNISKLEKRRLEPLKELINTFASGWPWLPVKDELDLISENPNNFDFGSGELQADGIMNTETKNWSLPMSLERLLGKLNQIGLSPTKLFGVGVINDFNDWRIKRITVDQYDPTEEINRRKRNDVTDDIINNQKVTTVILLLTELGVTDIKDEILRMITLNLKLDTMIDLSEDRKNFTMRNNKMTIEELTVLTKNKFNWIEYFNAVFEGILSKELNKNEIIVVQDKRFFTKFTYIFDIYNKNTIANLAVWNALIDPLLSHAYSNMTEFKNELRDYLCIPAVSERLPFAIGRLFTDAYTNDSILASANKFIKQLRESFKEIISRSAWLDRTTKINVKKKLDQMVQMVGFPDWIKDDKKLDDYYKNVDIGEDHLMNVLNAKRAQTNRSLIMLVENSTKVWLDEVGVVNVNAFYDPSTNVIIFPIGIIQIPFYEDNRLTAMNFGGVGSVIGHEIGHAFDIIGSQFNENGELIPIWSQETQKTFLDKIQCYVDQYNNYCFQGTAGSSNNTCLDGTLTVGENTPDNIGVQAAFSAYKAWIGSHKKEKRLPGLGDFSPEQVFFLSFAYIWCDNNNAKKWFTNHKHDTHSPGRYRVQGALSNFKEFAHSFHCKKGPMNRMSDRCTLW